MDLLNTTLVLYLMVGAGIAFAVYLTDQGGKTAEGCFRVVSAVPFWPLYVPLLLRPTTPATQHHIEPERPDSLAAAIVQVDGELEAALGSLDGWAEGVLTREKDRLQELRSAWIAQAQRIREMDRLLAGPRPAAAV